VRFTIATSDPNPDHSVSLTADNLPTWASLTPVAGHPNTYLFSGTPTAADSSVDVTFHAVDNSDTALTTDQVVHIVINHSPVLAIQGNQVVGRPDGSLAVNTAVGVSVSFIVSASDPDPGQTVTLSADGVPADAHFDPSTGAFTWTPAPTDRTTTITFHATDDGDPALTTDQMITITVNHPPVFQQIAPQQVAEGSQLSFRVIATDPDPGQTVTLSADGVPADAHFDPSTGAFTWTPAPTDRTTTITFHATDDGDPALTTEQMVTITVNHPPTITITGSQVVAGLGGLGVNATAGSPVTFRVTVGDLNPDRSVSLTADNLPSWASLKPTPDDPNTYVFSGTPTQADQTTTITFHATDIGDPALTTPLTVTIMVNHPNVPPQFNVGKDGLADLTHPFSRTINWTDPDNDTWTVTLEFQNTNDPADDTKQTFTVKNPQGTTAPFPTTHSLILTHTFTQESVYNVFVTINDGTVAVTHSFQVNVLASLADITELQKETLTPGQLTTISLVDPTTGETGTIQVQRSADAGAGGSVQLAFYSANPTNIRPSGTINSQFFDIQISKPDPSDEVVMTFKSTLGPGTYKVGFIDPATGHWQTPPAIITFDPTTGLVTITFQSTAILTKTVFAVSLTVPAPTNPVTITPPVAAAAIATSSSAVSDSAGAPATQILTFTRHRELTVTVTAAGDRQEGSGDGKEVDTAWQELFGDDGAAWRWLEKSTPDAKRGIKPAAGPQGPPEEEIWFDGFWPTEESLPPQASAQPQVEELVGEPSLPTPVALVTDPGRAEQHPAALGMALMAVSPYLSRRHRGRNRRRPLNAN
jgi:hypothetical protein